MPTALTRAMCCLALAFSLTSCLEVEVRRTVNADLSGRESITLRVPKGAGNPAQLERFPGSFSGATCLPVRTETGADATVRRAEVLFSDVTRLYHQAEFLSSVASVRLGAGGIHRYSETITNNFYKSLGRAPSPEGRQAIAAAMDQAKAALAGARCTYTIVFPGNVLQSNAQRVNGNEATWDLTTEQLFGQRGIELTAEYHAAPSPAAASPGKSPSTTIAPPLAPPALGPAVVLLADAEPPAKAEKKEDAPPAKKEEAPAPKKEEAPAPKKEEAPAPKKEEGPAPKKEEAPPAKQEEAPPPKKEEAPAPKKEEVPAPKKEEAPAPKKEEAPAPKKEEAPPAKQEEAPPPKKEEAPAPKKEEVPAPKKEEAPAPKKEEAPAPKKEEAPPAKQEEAPPKKEEPPAPKKEETLAPKKEGAPATKKEEAPALKKEEPPVVKKEEPEPAPATIPSKPPVSLEPQPSDSEANATVKRLFKDALICLDQRKYKEAAEVLQKAIAAKPDSLLAARLYSQTVSIFLQEALRSENPELKAAAEKLQKIAYQGRIEELHDPNRIKELIADLTKNFLPRTFSMEELSIAGDYAVPHLIAFLLENRDPVPRSYAAYVLGRLKGTAVPAICEGLKCDNPMVRQIIIQSLEKINDPRSIPALLWAAQEPKGHPLVIAEAQRVVAKIAGDPAVLKTPAPVAFLQLAEDYYVQNPKVLLPHLYEHLVWRWDYDARELRSESVPRHLYPYRMAEEMCRNALLANPDYEPAVPTLICTYFAQQSLLEAFYSAIEGRKLTEEEEKEAALAKPIRDRLKIAPLAAHAAGKRFAYVALRRALRGSDELAISVSLACIQALRGISDGSPLPKPPLSEAEARKLRGVRPKEAPKAPPRRIVNWFGPKETEEPPPPPPPPNPYALPLDGSPLVEALSYPDKRVRYAAAEAIIALGPTFVIRDADKVMANLSQALSETAVRVALVVDEDEIAAEQLRPLLRDSGIMPELVRSQRDALARAEEIPPKDLLILSGQLKNIDPVEMLASLRRVYTLAATPTIVVATRSDRPRLAERLAKENVVFLITPFDAQSVKTAIEEALKKAPEPKNEAIAARYASSAARTLASVNPGTSVFKLEEAMPALLRTVATTTQPDSVRVPCAEALRHAANPRALPYLAEAYNGPKASKGLRLAVLEAIGACAAKAPTLPPGIVDIMARASYDDDFDFRRVAAQAYGLRGGAGANYVEVLDHLLGKKPPAPPAPPAPPEKPPEAKPEKAPAEKAPPEKAPAEKAPAEKAPAVKKAEEPAEKSE